MISFRPAFLPTVMMILMSILMIYLGLWQKERAVWKQGILSEMTQKWNSAPTLLPIAALSLKGDIHTIQGHNNSLLETHNMNLVKVTGEFLARPLFYRPANHKSFGKGYEVIAAFKTSEGVIPIALGIIPDEHKDDYILPKSKREVVGILRMPPADNNTSPKHKDLVATVPFTSFYKIYNNDLLPFWITATTDNHFDDVIKSREPHSFIENIPNNHNTYMWTWFLLAGTLWVIYIAWHYHTKRLWFGKKS